MPPFQSIPWAMRRRQPATLPEPYTLLRDAIDLTDQIALANEPDEISALETMRAISMRRMEAEPLPAARPH